MCTASEKWSLYASPQWYLLLNWISSNIVYFEFESHFFALPLSSCLDMSRYLRAYKMRRPKWFTSLSLNALHIHYHQFAKPILVIQMLNCVIIPRYLTTYVNAGEHFAQFNWIKYFSFIYLPSDQMISHFVFVVHTFQLHSPLSISKLKAFRYNRMIPMTSITKHFFLPDVVVIHRLLLSHVPKHCWSRQCSFSICFVDMNNWRKKEEASERTLSIPVGRCVQ